MLSIEYLPLDEMVPDETNAKRHVVGDIRASFVRFGYAEAIVVDGRTGKLVSGHGRCEALAAMRAEGFDPPEGVALSGDGRWTVPVQVGWSSANDDEARAFMVAANRLTELGGWDDRALAAILRSSQDQPLALVGTGFTERDLAALLARTSPVPPSEFPNVDPDALHIDYVCPACSYAWSGNPKPGVPVVPVE
jgi:ParB-like chromosome segregation protein Spo0J